MSRSKTVQSLTRGAPLAAVLALFSLALLPFYHPSIDWDRADAAVMKSARGRIKDGWYEGARRQLVQFRTSRKDSGRSVEASYLLAETFYKLAEKSDPFHQAFLTQALNSLKNAEDRLGEENDESLEKKSGEVPAHPPITHGDLLALRRRVAELMIRKGLGAPASKQYVALHERTGNPGDLLGRARALAVQAGEEREGEEARRAVGGPPTAAPQWKVKFKSATDLVAPVLQAAPAGERAKILGALAEMHWRVRDYGEVVRLIRAVREETPAGIDRALRDLELGKALTRAGRDEEALAALESAITSGELDPEKNDYQVALLYKAELLARAGDTKCLELCTNLIQSGARVAPAARFIQSRFERESRQGDWLETVEEGVDSLKGAAVLDEAGFDFPGFYLEIRRAWDAEADDAVLRRIASILGDLERLYPAQMEYVMDRGRVWRRAGALLAGQRGAEASPLASGPLASEDALVYVDALEARWRGGVIGRVPSGIANLGAAVADRYGYAADAFAAVADSRDSSEDQVVEALRSAADACLAGGIFPRAAALYRRAYELHPSARGENLYLHAVSLMKAGILGGDRGSRGALEAFGEFFQAARPENPRYALGLLNRGRILVVKGLGEDALEEFDRVLSDQALGIGPATAVWAQALLERGRTLLNLSAKAKKANEDRWTRAYRGDAVRALVQYLDRYSDEPARREGRVEANYHLARAEMEEGDWVEALGRVDAIRAMADDVPAGNPLVREAFFLRGELLMNQGRYLEAQGAFDAAYRRMITSPERLRGLIGRARANLALGENDNAVRDYENSLSIYNAVKNDLDASLAGYGAKFFKDSLDALRKELP